MAEHPAIDVLAARSVKDVDARTSVGMTDWTGSS
jgi:hypothetical protein